VLNPGQEGSKVINQEKYNINDNNISTFNWKIYSFPLHRFTEGIKYPPSI